MFVLMNFMQLAPQLPQLPQFRNQIPSNPHTYVGNESKVSICLYLYSCSACIVFLSCAYGFEFVELMATAPPLEAMINARAS